MKTTNNLKQVIKLLASIGIMLLIFICIYVFITNQLHSTEDKIIILFTLILSSIMILLINKSNN